MSRTQRDLLPCLNVLGASLGISLALEVDSGPYRPTGHWMESRVLLPRFSIGRNFVCDTGRRPQYVRMKGVGGKDSLGTIFFRVYSFESPDLNVKSELETRFPEYPKLFHILH